MENAELEASQRKQLLHKLPELEHRLRQICSAAFPGHSAGVKILSLDKKDRVLFETVVECQRMFLVARLYEYGFEAQTDIGTAVFVGDGVQSSQLIHFDLHHKYTLVKFPHAQPALKLYPYTNDTERQVEFAKSAAKMMTALFSKRTFQTGGIRCGVYSMQDLSTLILNNVPVRWRGVPDFLTGLPNQSPPVNGMEFLCGIIDRIMYLEWKDECKFSDQSVWQCLRQCKATVRDMEANLQCGKDDFVLFNPNMRLQSVVSDESGAVRGVTDWDGAMFLPKFLAIPPLHYEIFKEPNLCNEAMNVYWDNVHPSIELYTREKYNYAVEVGKLLLNPPLGHYEVKPWVLKLDNLCSRWESFKATPEGIDMARCASLNVRSDHIKSPPAHSLPVSNETVEKRLSGVACNLEVFSIHYPIVTFIGVSRKMQDVCVVRILERPTPATHDKVVQTFLAEKCPKLQFHGDHDEFGHDLEIRSGSATPFTVTNYGPCQQLSTVWESLSPALQKQVARQLGEKMFLMGGVTSFHAKAACSEPLNVTVSFGQDPNSALLDEVNGTVQFERWACSTVLGFLEFQLERWKRLSYQLNQDKAAKQHEYLDRLLVMARELELLNMLGPNEFTLYHPSLFRENVLVTVNNKAVQIRTIIGWQDMVFAPKVLLGVIPECLDSDDPQHKATLATHFRRAAGWYHEQYSREDYRFAQFVCKVAVHGVPCMGERSVRLYLESWASRRETTFGVSLQGVDATRYLPAWRYVPGKYRTLVWCDNNVKLVDDVFTQ